MNKSLSYKTKQFFWLILKIAIVFLCGYFMYVKIFRNENISFSDFYHILTENDIISFKTIFILFVFTFFNWFFEILKWKEIVKSIKKITFFEAKNQSLASLTASLITPNRIGEYPAKALYFDAKIRKKILSLNFIHNSFQFATTLFFGFFGVLFLMITNKIKINFTSNYNIIFYIILFLIVLFIIIKKVDFIKKQLQKAKLFFEEIPKIIKTKTILFSILRYVIFSHQFYFLILIFNIEINYAEAIAAIAAMYFISSIIPMLSLLDVVLKSAVAVFIFSLFEVDELKILSISLLMWIFNFVFPAFLGSYFVVTFKQNNHK